jgi:hypothetical protein
MLLGVLLFLAQISIYLQVSFCPSEKTNFPKQKGGVSGSNL